MDVSENLSMAKKKEIQHLMHMVQLVGTPYIAIMAYYTEGELENK